MAYTKNITFVAIVGSMILGSFAIFVLRGGPQRARCAAADGQNTARSDYAEGKFRLLLIGLANKKQIAGIAKTATAYAHSIPVDTQLTTLWGTSGVYRFAEAYNQTMERLLAFEHKPTAHAEGANAGS